MARFVIVAVAGVLTVWGSASRADACWCSRVFTRSYFDPCVACPTVSRTYLVPTVAACPTTSCSTTNVERCYYQPEIAYVTQTLMQAQQGYVRRSYYDPVSCCYRSYLEPVTQYVPRSYQVPVTSWVKRCTTEPVTACTTVPEIRGSSYWSPDGYHYYPLMTTVRSESCPVPDANGSSQRGSSYPATNGASSNNGTKVPGPMPLPEKKDGARSPGLRRSAPAAARPVPHGRAAATYASPLAAANRL